MRMKLICTLVAGSLVLGGCKDQAKESAKHATEDVDMLADQIDKDVAEVERGMPDGAKKLSVVYAKGADPHNDDSPPPMSPSRSVAASAAVAIASA